MKNSLNLQLIAKNALIIYLAGTAVNLVIYYITTQIGGFGNTDFEKLNGASVVGSSFVFAILGAVVFGLAHKFYKANPALLYRVLGYGFLGLYAIVVLTIPGFSNLGKLYFEVGHLVLGVPFIEFMIRGYHAETSK
jgi:hypothetical protein